MFDWKQYKSQGVQAVDMCAASIALHREKMLPIKAIHLLPSMYAQFKNWLEKTMERELLADEKMQFDDVYIELGDRTQSTPLLIEMYLDQKELQSHLKLIHSTNIAQA